MLRKEEDKITVSECAWYLNTRLPATGSSAPPVRPSANPMEQ